MTNEEKIEEIVIDVFNGWSKVGFTYEEMIAILSKFAEWKDQQFKELHNPAYSTGFADGRNIGAEETKQQFKEYLEKKQAECNGTSCSAWEVYDEIISELSKRNNYEKN